MTKGYLKSFKFLSTVFGVVHDFYIFNKCLTYEDKEIVDSGGWFVFNELDHNSIYVSEATDGEYYRAFRPYKDPVMFWQARITYKDGRVEKEIFESSNTLRILANSLDTGDNWHDIDKCNRIRYWLGRSHISNSYEWLYYFNVESSHQLRKVCKYYSVNYPIPERLEKYIDNDRTAIRFKSVDLYDRGEGNFEEIIPAAIVFSGGKPVSCKLLITQRSNQELV